MKKIPCEIYSRVVGYYQPVENWNIGKREELRERKMLNITKTMEGINGPDILSSKKEIDLIEKTHKKLDKFEKKLSKRIKFFKFNIK